MSIWDDEKLVQRLVEVWNSGASGSETAKQLSKEFRFEIRRNMVIAKVHRLRAAGVLKDGARDVRTSHAKARRHRAAPRPRKQVPKAAPTRVMSGLFLGGGGTLPPVEPLPKEDVPPANLKSFAEIGPGDCRYIYGDTREPSHGFCPNSAVPGQSWCAHHARRVFRAPEPVHRAPKPERIPTMADLEKV